MPTKDFVTIGVVISVFPEPKQDSTGKCYRTIVVGDLGGTQLSIMCYDTAMVTAPLLRISLPPLS